MKRFLLWMTSLLVVSGAFAAEPAVNGASPQVRFVAAQSALGQPARENRARLFDEEDTRGRLFDEPTDEELSYNKPQPIEAYLEAVPPPDPPAPQWGSLEQPLREPPRFPVYDYLQAGPPRSVIQREWQQPYRRPIDDANRLPFEDERMNLPIDLYRPDGLAPPGVTGDHTLKTGHVLFSYRYSVVGYQASLIGTHLATAGRVLQQFNYAPQRMYQQQHLLLLEYAPTDNLTLMTQLPFQANSISYLTDAGTTVRDSYAAPGDVSVWALYVLKRWRNHQIHANYGISVPSNLLQSQNHFSTPGSLALSYPLRVGSGSYEILPGVTYRGQSERWTWGLQTLVTVPLGHNAYGYELGNRIDINAWAWRRITRGFAASGRLHGMGWGNVRGFDRGLTPTLAETAAPNLQAGTRLDLLFGGQFYVPWVRVPGNYFSIESGFPIYQNLHGPQPRATWLLNAGWNMMW